jgi:glycosyltransferase involved in cell wall biosynthesis
MESDFDVIHLHNPLIPVIYTSLPTIITEHGTVKGGIARREVLDFFSLGLKVFSGMYVSIERKLVNNADKVTAVSNSCADELKLYYGVKNVEVVYNGVDTIFFVPNGMRNENEPSILYTGSLDALKGLFDLIRSAEHVCQDYQNVKFILAGRGPLEKKLKRFVHNLGLEKKISFIGYVNQETLLKYYQNATIFVHPSYHEGLPTTILEAMSCEIPTVATAVTGTSEVLVDGKTGFLVPPKDPEKLATAISSLLNDKKLRERMGKNAKEHVKRNFDWVIIAKKFEEIYSNRIK